MPEFFDYDPVEGVTQLFDYNEATGDAKITYVQDIEPFLKRAKAARDENVWKLGVKENWAKYADLPLWLIVELRKKGIDALDPAHVERVLQEINENYPALKCTDAHEGSKRRLYV